MNGQTHSFRKWQQTTMTLSIKRILLKCSSLWWYDPGDPRPRIRSERSPQLVTYSHLRFLIHLPKKSDLTQCTNCGTTLHWSRVPKMLWIILERMRSTSEHQADERQVRFWQGSGTRDHMTINYAQDREYKHHCSCVLLTFGRHFISVSHRWRVKVHTLDIAPLRSESPPQKRSGMARVLKGFHSFTCTPTRSSAIGMSHTCLCLPSRSWHSFTEPGGMEGWVDLGAK